MNGRLLMAHIDDANALVYTTVVERHDMTAGERKKNLHPSLLESAGSKFSAVYGHVHLLGLWGADA
jgi:hypothetical protein